MKVVSLLSNRVQSKSRFRLNDISENYRFVNYFLNIICILIRITKLFIQFRFYYFTSNKLLLMFDLKRVISKLQLYKKNDKWKNRLSLCIRTYLID